MAVDIHPATAPMQDDANGDMLVDDAPLRENAFRFAAGGVILPPPDIKCAFCDLSSHPNPFSDACAYSCYRQDSYLRRKVCKPYPL
jgi:hypothetical protein